MIKFFLLNLLLLNSFKDSINEDIYYQAYNVIKADFCEKYFDDFEYFLRKKYHIDSCSKINFRISNLLYNRFSYIGFVNDYIKKKYPDIADSLKPQLSYSLTSGSSDSSYNIADTNFSPFETCNINISNVIIYFSRLQDDNTFIACVYPYYKKCKDFFDYDFIFNERISYMFILDEKRNIDTVLSAKSVH